VWVLGACVVLLLAANASIVAARTGGPSPSAAQAATAPDDAAAPSDVVDEAPDDVDDLEDDEQVPPDEATADEALEAPPAPTDQAPEFERIELADAEPGWEAFEGLSTWIDLYDIELTPEQQARRAHAAGVQAIYVQTARFNSPDDIHDADRLARLIEASHDLGMEVMTWYIPDFVDPERDLRRSKAAIAFETPRGDRPAAFGLDIEVEAVDDIAERSRRLVWLSQQLREWAGPDYPMAAVVLPPLQLDMRPDWWPDFPWQELRPYYDVYLPMSYSSFRGTDAATTYEWNLANIHETRRRTGDPDLPIHMAGGIADELPEVEAFVAALRDGNVLGGGLYDLHVTPPESWPALRALRAE
jgi:hypothetical protein